MSGPFFFVFVAFPRKILKKCNLGLNFRSHIPPQVLISITFMFSLPSFSAGINSIKVSLLSVSGNDLNTQHVEVNCFTFRVGPYEVTWSIDSELITPIYNYLRMNGSELLDRNNQTYRQYISLKGSFSNGTIISCSTDVNGETETEEYVLKGIKNLILRLIL